MAERLLRDLDPSRKLWPEGWLNEFRQAIKECDISHAELVRGYMKMLCVYDYSYFRMLRRHFGDQKALEMHAESWLRNIPDYVDQAKNVYDIDEPVDFTGFGYLIKYSFNEMGCRFDITEWRAGKLVAYISNCILSEYAKERFPPEGDPIYDASIHQIQKAMIDGLAKATDLHDRIAYALEEGKLIVNLK